MSIPTGLGGLDYRVLQRMAAIQICRQLATAIRQSFPNAEYVTYYYDAWDDENREWVEIRDAHRQLLWGQPENEEMSLRQLGRSFLRRQPSPGTLTPPQPAIPQWQIDSPPLEDLDELVPNDGFVLQAGGDDTWTFRLSVIDTLTFPVAGLTLATPSGPTAPAVVADPPGDSTARPELSELAAQTISDGGQAPAHLERWQPAAAVAPVDAAHHFRRHRSEPPRRSRQLF
jgi:hypothetical protein